MKTRQVKKGLYLRQMTKIIQLENMAAVRKTNTWSQPSPHQDIVPYQSTAYLTIAVWEQSSICWFPASNPAANRILSVTLNWVTSFRITQLSLHHAQLQQRWPDQLSPPTLWCDIRLNNLVWQEAVFSLKFYKFASVCIFPQKVSGWFKHPKSPHITYPNHLLPLATLHPHLLLW